MERGVSGRKVPKVRDCLHPGAGRTSECRQARVWACAIMRRRGTGGGEGERETSVGHVEMRCEMRGRSQSAAPCRALTHSKRRP